MGRQSAGILMYRRSAGRTEVLLIHPGGPYWRRRDEGAWSIPKGEFAEGEEPLDAACREFREETGGEARGEFTPLGRVRQASGKVVHAWAVEGEFDPASLRSNTFTMEWPPGSGSEQEFPEADRAAWYPIEAARARIIPSQQPLLDALEERLRTGEVPSS